MARNTLIWLILLFAMVGSAGANAAAGASEWARAKMADVRLVSAAATTGSADSVPLGLQFKLAEGWKIYWRSPGEAGVPPDLEIKSSKNLRDTRWRWPVPERFSLFGLESYGYHDEVVFPITARLLEPGKPLVIDAVVHALVCSEICVPLDAALSFTLPAGPGGPTAFTQLISRFHARVPSPLNGAGLTVEGVGLVGTPTPHSISVAIASDDPMTAPDVFVEAAEGYAFGKPKIILAADRRNAVLTIPTAIPKNGGLQALPVTLTVVDGDRFIEIKTKVGATWSGGFAGAAPPLPSAPMGVWITMLGIALLGGLVLNLMPCVLPVLSLKLLNVARYGGAARGVIRRGFLASAAGIITSFLLLAAGAIALKQSGLAVGWGMQFQQPLFLTAMVVLLAGFAANLFGWFAVPLPEVLARIATPAPAPSTPHMPAQGKRGLSGHFMTGAFATLLATPCSAPFLGTALGFALARGLAEILAIFLAMGLGLALPYILVAVFPGLVRMLPRPGRWMEKLRVVLGLALLATAVWLLTVIAAQLDMHWLLAIAGLVVVAGGLLAFARRHHAPSLPVAAGLAVVALIIGGVADRKTGPAVASGIETAAARLNTDEVWIEFDISAVTALVAEGRVVLVDVTADWCLTCKVNKSLVLDRGEIARRLTDGDIIAMRADWTTPNPRIAAYLASFGRYGIPFNAVYGPAAPDGIALPELLSESAVLDAFDKAGGPGDPRNQTASVLPAPTPAQ
jgi:suppressor for copper-sensitivity B